MITFKFFMTAGAVLLAGCAAQVTEHDGRTVPLGAWLDSWKSLPKSPADAQAAASSSTPSNRGATKPVPVPAAAPGHSSPRWPAEQGCRVVDPFLSRLDVDTVYARAMTHYDFISAEQVALRRQNDRYYVQDQGYLHEKQPGSFYHLAQQVTLAATPGGPQGMWLDIEVAKEPGGSRIAPRYCIASTDAAVGTVAFHQSLQRRLRDQFSR